MTLMTFKILKIPIPSYQFNTSYKPQKNLMKLEQNRTNLRNNLKNLQLKQKNLILTRNKRLDTWASQTS